MTQVSEIIVSWTPEISGRVQSMQIQSRIVGTLQWSEVASGLDPTLGTITFASNAPGSDIEVRGRYRMVAGVFSPWVTMHITSGGVKVDYTTGIKGLPTTLAEISPGEAIKLEGAWNQAQTANGKADDALGNVADLQTANIAHLTSIANAELARIRARALDFPGPDGASTYTLHKREETAREDADAVFVETFELLGAVTPDGSAFILDDNTVKVTKTEAGATSLQSVKARFDGNEGAIEEVKQSVVDQDGAFSRAMTTIDARFAGNEGEISDIKEVFADENGTVARALLRVDANGRVIGFAATNDGRRGDFTVTADRFTIQDPDSGTAYFYADDTGKVIMRDVEVDTLKIGAMDPEFIEKQEPFDGREGTQILPGGVVMKWGKYRAFINSETVFSIVFVEPFPNSCDAFVPTPYLNSFSNLRDLWIQNIGIASRFGATVATQAATGDDQRLDGFDWIAFGR